MKKYQFDLIIKTFLMLSLCLISDNATFSLSYSPFSIGIFVGLCFSSQNFLIALSCYLLSGIIHNPVVEVIVCRVSASLVLYAYIFASKKLKKNITLPVLNIVTFLSRLPETAYMLSNGVGVYVVITWVIIGQVFAYISSISIYAIFVRGIRVRFTVDELVCICLTSIVLFCGLYGFSILGLKPFFIVASFFALMISYSLGPYGVVFSVIMGIGAGFAGDLFFILNIVCGALIVLAFRNVSPILAGIAFCLTVCGVGYFFDGQNFSYIEVIAIVVGTLLFCFLPKKIMKELSGLMFAVRERYGGRGIVNRNRWEISKKLSSLASLFWDLSSMVTGSVKKPKEEDNSVGEIARIVVENFCGSCAKKIECEQILKGKTDELIAPAVQSSLNRGRATLLELPSYMTGSCIKVGGLIPEINRTVEEFVSERKEIKHTENGKILLGEQLFLTGELLGSISVDMRKSVGFDTQKERIVIDELAHKNVVCSEVVIENDLDRIVLYAKGAEYKKRTIEKVVSKIMKKGMIARIDKEGERNGFDMVFLDKKVPRDMAFGCSVVKKDGSSESGDSQMMMRVGKDKYLFAIADGMGSGKKAGEQSLKAVSMIESFYKAGFNRDTVIGLVNKLLTFSGGECYNTLDMCVVDLMENMCDFIKLGASASFLKRGESVEVIEGESLPMGVFGDAKPTVVTKKVKENDMIIIASDGVSDSIGLAELIVFIERMNTPNPQEIANAIKKRATERGALDDVSVVVGKIYKTK